MHDGDGRRLAIDAAAPPHRWLALAVEPEVTQAKERVEVPEAGGGEAPLHCSRRKETRQEGRSAA